MTGIEFRVFGVPGAQGSKVRTKHGMRESSKKVAPWRQDVVAAARQAIAHTVGFETFTGPVAVRVTFYLPRPKSHYRSGAHAGELKLLAPVWVTTKPDGDKVLRSTFDALTTAGVWRDDSLAVKFGGEKLYDSLPGAFVRVTPLAVTE